MQVGRRGGFFSGFPSRAILRAPKMRATSPRYQTTKVFPLSKRECKAARNGPDHPRTGRHTGWTT
jgi:hypothetical protein